MHAPVHVHALLPPEAGLDHILHKCELALRHRGAPPVADEGDVQAQRRLLVACRWMWGRRGAAGGAHQQPVISCRQQLAAWQVAFLPFCRTDASAATGCCERSRDSRQPLAAQQVTGTIHHPARSPWAKNSSCTFWPQRRHSASGRAGLEMSAACTSSCIGGRRAGHQTEDQVLLRPDSGMHPVNRQPACKLTQWTAAC